MKTRDFIILVGGAANAPTCAQAFAAKTLAPIGVTRDFLMEGSSCQIF